MTKVLGTVTVGNVTVPDPAPSNDATVQAQAALAARMAGGPDNTVARAAPIDKDRFPQNPAWRIG